MSNRGSGEPKRIVVIGGGVTGLAAAHRVHEIARERSLAVVVMLLEGSDRLGGVIGTEQRDGFLLEWGPDSFITDKPWALDLCRRLGLEERLIGTDPTHRRSFVVKGERLLPVPEGFQLLAPSRLWPFVTSPIFSWAGKFRIALDWILPPRRDDGDESLADFVERRLGREALERMAQPMIAGIYGADPRTLSLRATMPRFLEMERAHGSVIRAMVARRRGQGPGARGQAPESPVPAQRVIPSTRAAGDPGCPRSGRSQHRTPATGVSGARYSLFVSFRSGMQTLVEALMQRLPAGCARLSARVERLSRREDGTWQIALRGSASRGGEVLEADAVCVALPSYRAAELLQCLDPELAAALAAIPYASSATVNLAYRRADVAHPLNGFGFVVPAVEKRSVLGCTFSSVKFPGRAPEGHALLRAFVGESGLGERDDAAVEAAVRADLRDLLGITPAPLFALISRQNRAMAQYAVGHLDRVAALESAAARHPGLALAGNAYRGIGIPDCVHSGEQAAERLMG